MSNEKELRRLVKIKEQKKKKNPTFRTQNSWRYKRVDSRWRRPRGIDSKMQEKQGGWPDIVKVGYRKPKKVRNLHISHQNGFQVREEFIVNNLSDLELVLPHKHVIRIAKNVGLRKKEQIYSEAKSWGLRVLNPVHIEEDLGEAETAEDLSLDRELDMDLDLDDVEESKDLNLDDSENKEESKDLNLDDSEDIDAEEPAKEN